MAPTGGSYIVDPKTGELKREGDAPRVLTIAEQKERREAEDAKRFGVERPAKQPGGKRQNPNQAGETATTEAKE